MKLWIVIILAIIAFVAYKGVSFAGNEGVAVETIKPEQAKEIMESGREYILLDVRTREEYDANGHLKNAVLIPDYELTSRALAELPDKNALRMVYCRSGRRSLAAARALADMGYSNVKDIGGIINWPYDIEK